MLETLLCPAEPSLSLAHAGFPPSASVSSVFDQYLSLDPFLIAGTALALYIGCTRKSLVDLAIPVAVASADNLFRKLTDTQYTFEHFGGDVKIETLFVLGAYLLGLFTSCATRAYAHRRHHSQRS